MTGITQNKQMPYFHCGPYCPIVQCPISVDQLTNFQLQNLKNCMSNFNQVLCISFTGKMRQDSNLFIRSCLLLVYFWFKNHYWYKMVSSHVIGSLEKNCNYCCSINSSSIFLIYVIPLEISYICILIMVVLLVTEKSNLKVQGLFQNSREASDMFNKGILPW